MDRSGFLLEFTPYSVTRQECHIEEELQIKKARWNASPFL